MTLRFGLPDEMKEKLLKKQKLKEMAETLRSEGFVVSHNRTVIEDSAEGCCDPDKELDEMDLYGFMDRASIMFEQFNEVACNSHVICKDEKARKMCEEISGKLWDLYQYAGGLYFDKLEEKESDARGEAIFNDRGD